MANPRLRSWAGPTHSNKWYRDNCCPACGLVNNTGEMCKRVHICKLCGASQCASVLGNCKLCLYGLLEGFSGHSGPCDYKGCDEERVARGQRGKKHVCRKHFFHQRPDFEVPNPHRAPHITSTIGFREGIEWLYDTPEWKERFGDSRGTV